MSLLGLRKLFHRSGKWILGIVTVAMLVTAFTGIGANMINMRNAAGKAGSDPTIASVNGMPIKESEYQRALNQIRQMAQLYGQPQSVLTSGQDHAEALNELIQQDLIVQNAQQQGITATSADLDAARQQQLPGLRQNLGLPANASEQQVDTALQKYNGETVEQAIPDDILRPQVIRQKYEQNLARSIRVNDQDVQAFYRQYHIRHILISDKTRSQVQAQALANAVLAKLKAGANFTQLAQQYSDDPGVKFNKGDDGWIGQSVSFVPEFKKAAFSLAPGQITPAPVYSSQYGYFIIQCVGVKENLPKDYAKNKQMYTSQVAATQEQQQEQDAFNAALAKAKIVVNDPQLRADRELLQAQGEDASNPVKRNADLAAAITDYQKALPKANFSAQGEIHAGLAHIYELENQPDKEIAELSATVQSAGTPELNMMLGDLYRKKGDTKDALAQFQLASDAAYDDQNTHMMLEQIYAQMHQPKLAAKEAALVADYKKRQQAMASYAPPGATITPGPGGKGMVITPPAKKAH